MDIYNARLFELAAEIPPHRGLALDAMSQKVSRLCGSDVSLALSVDGKGKINDFDMSVKACALGQASAGIFAKYAIGATHEEVIKARDALKAMLKEDGPPPSGRFWELRYLQSVADFPPRHGSVMLIFDAAIAAFDAILIKEGKTHESEYCRT